MSRMRIREALKLVDQWATSGGPGGGGGLALAPNGAFGDPTQVPCFVGFFHDANDLLSMEEPYTVPWKQGCWAIAGHPPVDDPTPGSYVQPTIWIFDSDGGSWEEWFTAESAKMMIQQEQYSVPFTVNFAGNLAVGQKRGIALPFYGKFTTVDAFVATPAVMGATGTHDITFDVLIGALNSGVDADDFAGASIFGATKPKIPAELSGQTHRQNWASRPTPPPVEPQSHFISGQHAEIVITGVGDITPGADLVVTLAAKKIYGSN